MGRLLEYKRLYLSAFDNCRPILAVVLLKAYSFFCFALISITVYAFLYRAFTGFRF
ncbi:DUF6747 family protein [Cellulophaga omnivescoria]|uniref:DUF6747 family protein n=1 Tax=Cellulophaga omnivescoria TaxID=1888890 RepID=UPI0015C54A9C|nr:DUF6747 family protein [Cellulophaga omnivescoria]WKB82135.1 hypothetical protein QYR09_03645 [Cellulophaga lytica]